MDLFLKIAAGAIISVILATTLRGRSKELSAAFSILACTVLALSGLSMFRTAASYLQSLRELANIDSALLTPVLTVCAIGLLSRLCVSFCQEAGEGAIGNIVSLCGNLAAVCDSLPLLDTVHTLVRDFLR